MKKAVAAGLIAASIAGGSVGVAALAPLGFASAQGGSSTTTTPPATAPAPKGARNGVLTDTLKSLVADGTITQDQADKITARLQQNLQQFRAAHPKVAAALRPELDKAASVLGITVDDLKAQLKAGKSLATIAGAKTPDLIKALTDDANARIDAAVTSGKLAPDKAAALKAKTADRITAIVNGTAPLPGTHARRGH